MHKNHKSAHCFLANKFAEAFLKIRYTLDAIKCTLVTTLLYEFWVRSLVKGNGRENPLQKKMATFSSILAERISWTEKPGGPQSLELQRNETQLGD